MLNFPGLIHHLFMNSKMPFDKLPECCASSDLLFNSTQTGLSEITQIWHFCTKFTSRGFKQVSAKNKIEKELNSQLTITGLEV